jgi:outer membrane lipase/esterase
MRRIVWHSLIAVCLSVAGVAAHAATPSYDALYVFGDSYCDVGNIFRATHGAEPPPPYYDGRFSNGPIWLDHAAGFLGVPLKASLLGGTDYAFGGAWVTEGEALTRIPSVPEQVELYLSTHGGKADPNALYILEGGGNDILDSPDPSPEDLGRDIAKGIKDSEKLLREAGVKHFVIPDVFDVGLLPAAAERVSFAEEASVATNQALDELLAPEQCLDGIQILRMNVFSLLNAVEKAPTHFGFTDITDPCLTATGECSGPDHTYFWDTHHPTEFGHAFFAVTLENVLNRHD